ncbi:hypothetical protein SK355_04910 [Candidatus Fukatsuia symbiotica]|uniref:Protein kinase domain-containing protein n=1 Tax=Candidatus Fukatsuia symbiotica TaxID=1878942 RepID=A0A2U8I5E0_9GAMM|nr:hypothetical protein [Candidatus Fukatsuia symbiotica]AWK14367.1 hypothetical protein CCS41_07585 [Candidatus Fukatsuia symbiotica]MEA9444632.1 hypothetical protein [Candidatus Fukatsuia symbiotica]
MATSLNVNGSVFICSDTRMVRMINGDRKTAIYMGIFDRFFDLFRKESKREKIEKLYDELHQDLSDESKITTSRRYSINQLIIFSKIRDMATFDQQDKFTVSVQEEKMDFFMAGSLIYTQSISKFTGKFIRCKCLYANQTMREKEQLTTLVERHKKFAINKIKNYFNLHREKLKKIKRDNDMLGLDKDFSITKYKGFCKAHRGRTYYFHVGDKYPVLYAPPKEKEDDMSYLEGNYKQVDAMDERFVVLVPKDNNNKLVDFDRSNNESNLDLAGIKTLIPGWVVDDNVIIARNAGEDLYNYIYEITGKRKTIDVRVFREALRDLKTLHQKGIYLIDIKIENMAYNENKKIVNLIDIENRVKRGGKCNHGVTYSEYSATKDLLCYYTRYHAGEKYYDYDILRVWDEYAFLLSMIACTAKSNDLHKAVMRPDVDIEGGGYLGAMNMSNNSLFMKWIHSHVNSLFYMDIAELLKNPARLARVNPDHAYLADMLTVSS